jgi:hypothetical protein
MLGNKKDAVQAIIEFARIVFGIHPFAPHHLPSNWEEITTFWLNGEPVGALSKEHSHEV